MTLVTAWVRATPGGNELVVASDSRLTGGLLLNHAPKIFRLERQDAVIAYCGPTIIAYPILLQIKASLDGYEETRSRILDIVHLKAHIEKVIESLRSKVSDLPSNDGTNREFKFLLAGYSWKTSTFRMWTFRYDVTTGEFNAYSARKSGSFLFMSDQAANEKRALHTLMRAMARDPKASLKRLNWEPLEVLMGIIRDPDVADVGGPPQMVKIYKHANILPINIIWPKQEELESQDQQRKFEVTHLGRPLLGYERSRYLSVNPDTLELIEPWNVAKQLASIQTKESTRVQTCLRTSLCRTLASLRNKRAREEILNRMIQKKADVNQIKTFLERSQATSFSIWYAEPATESLAST